MIVLLLIVIAVAFYFLLPNIDSTPVYPSNPTVLGSTTTNITPPPPSGADWYEVYFTSPKIPFDNIYTGGIENSLIEKINLSQTSIDLAVFEFDIEAVAQALIDAEKRGVEVRVVYDNEHTDTDPQIKELIASGIQAVPDERSAYMHNKFFVFDHFCVWTGSFNISMNAAYRNNENAIFICSTDLAKNYQTEFFEMFSGQFGSSSPSDTPYPVITLNGHTIENYFAPEDEVMAKIIALINSANTSIQFMAFSFTDDSLGEAMLNKAKKGVVVEGIFETSGADTQYSECGRLLRSGLDIRLDGNPRTFHHKVIIIDAQIVIFGSFNFSSNADTQNDENLLIINDTRLAQDYINEYLRMKAQAVVPQNGLCQK